MRRRGFLATAGCFVASAALPGLLGGCTGTSDPSRRAFPQGIASGDPRPGSVVVWTRVRPPRAGQDPVVLTVEFADDPAFASLRLREEFAVSDDSDHTLRVLVTALQPDTVYYYRFRLDAGITSPTGRTMTAPHPDTTSAMDFAFVSCQDRTHGFYGAYRRLINDDLRAPPERRLRFVLHLGDFIYETLDAPWQRPLDANLEPLPGNLLDRNGNARVVAPLPVGARTDQGVRYAATLADYRHLYREYLADPDLQAARARWPFIHVWDDHEFSDDCWQTEANYHDGGGDGSTDEPSQRRKVAANQAWFEYMPVDLAVLEGVDDDLREAREFSPAEVGETPNALVDDDNLAVNADNRRAIDTLSIYRSFRLGSLLELVVTDNRSYRSDHALPEDLGGNPNVFVHPRAVLPRDLVNALDAGRTANGGNPDTFLFLDSLVLNPRRSSPPGTILGARQKQWWKQTMLRSPARWKVWANSVPLQRMLINLSALGGDLPDVIASGDTWDGYRTERNELMRFLLDNGVSNVLSLSGDIHAHLAGVVMEDHDAAPPRPAMTELVCAAVSSVSQFAVIERLSRRAQPTGLESMVRRLIAYRDPASELVNNLNNTLLNGVAAGLAAAATNSLEDIAAARDPGVNPHLVYADTEAHGFGRVRVTEQGISAELVTLEGIDSGHDDPPIRRSARFEIPHAGAGEAPRLLGPTVTGRAPFPLT